MSAPAILRRIGAAPVLGCALIGCTTVDPGGNFVVPETNFDPDYFYCHVEPELIVAKRCGSGDPALGDRSNGCHFNSAAVTAMALRDHPAVDCAGGDHPLDRSQVGTGSPAQSNFEAVSFDMSKDYATAPLVVRPGGSNHPRAVIDRNDPQILRLLQTWAAR
ncbi:MAG: hypothetical protein M3O50_11965 [Myxococcota bacterium]|nr:hypothetical protein [Myxococcota bacterium]